MYAVAETLGKFAWEVMELMPLDEFTTWVAYLKIVNDDIKKANKKPSPTR